MASLRTTKEINLRLRRITVPECDVGRKGKKLGIGAYGAVFAVKYRRQTCAAKEIHPVLLEGASEEAKEKILDVFTRECCQCSELNHPNIVKFIGVYFPNKQLLPVMLMELLDKSLMTYLEVPETQVTLMVKSSILIDIAEGLSYLHKRYHPIIHRDLTPNNILLKLPCDEEGIPIAKISDLGLAKAIETNMKVNQKFTKAPGTLHFMPPETLTENPVYNTSLDIFSYGGVVLFVSIQMWPRPTVAMKPDRKTNKLIPCTEVERRQEYLDKMKNGAEIWKSTVEACLSNDPNARPKITWLSERLKSFKVCVKTA